MILTNLSTHNYYSNIINRNKSIEHKYHPSFTAYSERKSCSEYPFYTDTLFFRDDIDWENIVKYLDSCYRCADKVNIICHACSDGEEAYSLALKLISELGEKADKFFPILAKDIDSDNIQRAKDGIFRIMKCELDAMRSHSNFNLDKYFHIVYHNDEYIYASAKPAIKSKIIFEQSDIFNDVDTLKSGNTVLMCRNFWPYMPKEKAKTLASKICSKLGESDMVLVGYFDMFNGLVHKLLYDNGFEGNDIRGVFRKKNVQKTLTSSAKYLL